jgi:hypothetical protein
MHIRHLAGTQLRFSLGDATTATSTNMPQHGCAITGLAYLDARSSNQTPTTGDVLRSVRGRHGPQCLRSIAQTL